MTAAPEAAAQPQKQTAQKQTAQKQTAQRTVAQKLQVKQGYVVRIAGHVREERANSNVAVDDTWSAVRVRPLGDGEAPLG